MSKSGKLKKNVGLMAIGTFGSKLLTFFLVPLYTSCLTTTEYGIADLITTSVSLLAPVFTVTIGEAALRFALDKEENKQKVFTLGLMVQTLGFLLLLSLSPLILLVDILRPYYIYFILYYLSYTLISFFSYFTKGIDKIFAYTLSGVVQTAITVISNIITLLVFRWGIEGYLLSFVIANFVSATLLFILANLRVYFKITKIDYPLLMQMILYSVPMIPNSISWWVSNSSDKYILTYFCGATITGIYSVSYKIPTILSICYNIFLSAWRLSAVEDFGSEQSKTFYSIVFSRLFESLSLVAAFIILFNKTFARIMYAKDFFSARFYVPVLVIAVLLHGVGEFYGSVYTSAKKTKMLLYSSLFGAVLNIILNLVLIPVLGGFGAALATLLSYGAIVVYRGIHTKKIFTFHIEWKRIVIISLLLLIICILQTIDVEYSFICSLLITIVLIALCHSTIVSFMYPIVNKMKRRVM